MLSTHFPTGGKGCLQLISFSHKIKSNKKKCLRNQMNILSNEDAHHICSNEHEIPESRAGLDQSNQGNLSMVGHGAAHGGHHPEAGWHSEVACLFQWVYFAKKGTEVCR